MQINNNRELAIIERFKAIGLFQQGIITSSEVSSKLGISIRQVFRLIKRFKETNGSYLAFLPQPRIACNRVSPELEKKVVKLKLASLTRSNHHIADLVIEKFDTSVSPATVRRILIDHQVYKRNKTKRRTFNHFEVSKFGQLIQLDALSGAFLKGYPKIYLILALDDYSRYIVSARWVLHDTTLNNLALLRDIIENHGIPKMIYTDNASHFKTIRHGKSIYQHHKQKEYQTQFQRACLELNINMFSHRPYQPQSKGKIERLFRFIQGRFTPEHKAKNIDELNQEFVKWVDWYNQHHVNRMTQQAPINRTAPNALKPVDKQYDLDYILAIREKRKVDKCNSFSYQGIRYFLKPSPCLVACEVELAVTNDTISVYYRKKLVQKFIKAMKLI